MTNRIICELIREAEKIRQILEHCKENKISLIRNHFPIAHCKSASLLLTYHALKKWPFITIYGVGGTALDHKGNETISHYWLECQHTAIDLTADQYNILDEESLNKEIIASKPFKPISIGRIGSMPNYKLFKIAYRDTYVSGLPELAEDYLYDLQNSYEALKDLGLCLKDTQAAP